MAFEVIRNCYYRNPVLDCIGGPGWSNSTMNVYTLLPVFPLLANGVIAIYVLHVNPRKIENRLFFLLAMAIAFWSLIQILTFGASSAAVAWYWSRFDTLGATFTAVFALHFFTVFTRINPRYSKPAF